MKFKLTLIDYIIIILVICAIVFAFIHITTDDSSDLQKTAFDESTVNKIPDTYLKYYKDGYIVKATVDGFNSSNGEEVTITGDVIWQDNNGGADVKLLIDTDNETYLTGLYRYNPNSDIYIDHISLESNGEKYANLVEITAKPKNISALNDLISGIDNNTNFEITTRVSIDEITTNQLQELTNTLMNHGKRLSVKEDNDNKEQLIISKATKENINDASAIIGNINGISGGITIRIYDATDSQIKAIQDNYDVINIRNF